MKLKTNKQILPYFIYTFFTLCAVIVFYLIASDFSRLQSGFATLVMIFKPIIIGFAFAYILNIPYTKIQSKLKIKSEKKNKAISLIVTILSAFVLVSLFLMLVIPELINSLSSLILDFPNMAKEFIQFLDVTAVKLGVSEQITDAWLKNSANIMDTILQSLSMILPKLTDLITALVSGFMDIFLSFIISIYMLIEKDKLLYAFDMVRHAFLKLSHNDFIDTFMMRANKIFGGFLVGQLLDSFVVAMMNLVVMIAFSIPYAFLVAVIVLFTNIIPFFGSALGMIPSFFIIVFVSPEKAIIYLISALIIQQIDGNIIGPKILGGSLGISPFWVLFALLVSGNLFGFFGLLLGVPSFALFASFFRDAVHKRLQEK